VATAQRILSRVRMREWPWTLPDKGSTSSPAGWLIPAGRYQEHERGQSAERRPSDLLNHRASLIGLLGPLRGTGGHQKEDGMTETPSRLLLPILLPNSLVRGRTRRHGGVAVSAF
jgi:hypothetical protein